MSAGQPLTLDGDSACPPLLGAKNTQLSIEMETNSRLAISFLSLSLSLSVHPHRKRTGPISIILAPGYSLRITGPRALGASACGQHTSKMNSAKLLGRPSSIVRSFSPGATVDKKFLPLLPKLFSTWLPPSPPSPSCHSAKTQLLRSTQHNNLLHLSPAQWHLVAVQQLVPSAHSRSHALVHAENLKLH